MRFFEEALSMREQELLKCPKCGEDLRPHVLWFDEIYNEKYYKFQTVRRIADNTSLLFVVGTSGATYLPSDFIDRVSFFNGIIVDVNIEDNKFSDFLRSYHNSHIIRASSSVALPKIAELIKKVVASDKK